MSLRAIEDGIAALQTGDTRRGEQLLRQGLQSVNVPGDVRAVGYMWLATTSPNRQFQIQCYQAAIQADPNNGEARSRLDILLQQQQRSTEEIPMPPSTDMPPPAPRRPLPAPPSQLPGTGPLNADAQGAPQLWEFGVRGGPNGVGTAFMVVRDGLLATPRYVVGSQTEIVIETRDGQAIDAKVVRSYPEFDLAFIRTRITVPTLRDMTPTSFVPPDTPIVADDYTEQTISARCRSTRRRIAPGWFPTTFPDSLPRSFNGAPLLDDKDDLVGMLTRNADRNSGNLYGLHISLIRRKIEEYYGEIQTDPDRMYCGTCGSLSAAGAAGLYYCEICGTTLPFARRQQRHPHPEAHLYYPTDMQQ